VLERGAVDQHRRDRRDAGRRGRGECRRGAGTDAGGAGDGADCFGVDVNIAARLAEAAKPGEILVSGHTLDALDAGTVTAKEAPLQPGRAARPDRATVKPVE
jgi:class 3 adenylate cyclase